MNHGSLHKALKNAQPNSILSTELNVLQHVTTTPKSLGELKREVKHTNSTILNALGQLHTQNLIHVQSNFNQYEIVLTLLGAQVKHHAKTIQNLLTEGT